jgi:hypothetical protein
MIITQLERPKELIYDYDDWTECELGEWDINDIKRIGVEEIWYWYQTGSYEGSGQLLMRIGNEYDLIDLGHCSCNGPTEDVTFNGSSFNELENSRTEGLKVYTDILFEAARPNLKPDWEV